MFQFRRDLGVDLHLRRLVVEPREAAGMSLTRLILLGFLVRLTICGFFNERQARVGRDKAHLDGPRRGGETGTPDSACWLQKCVTRLMLSV